MTHPQIDDGYFTPDSSSDDEHNSSELQRIMDTLPTTVVTIAYVASMNDHTKCAICLEKYKVNDELRTLTCTHTFHRQCVDQWMQIKTNCPTCRKNQKI